MGRLISGIIAFYFMAATAAVAASAYPADLAARTSLLVLPFEYRGAAGERGAMADDYLMEAFAQLNRFTLVEREKLDQVLLEQKLSREKLTMPAQSIALGRLLAADQLLYGRIDETGGETVVTLRIVEASTSAARDYSAAAAAPGAHAFRRLMTGLAARVAADFPLVEGRIIRAAGDSYKADFAGAGLRNGLEVIIYRWGEEVRHPATARQLGRRAIRIASGTITAVTGRTSSLVLSRVEKGRKVNEGDLVITR